MRPERQARANFVGRDRVAAVASNFTNGAPAALTISASTAQTITGMSWQWCCRFARAHGVTILRVGERKQLIPANELMAAISRVAAEHAPQRELSEAEMAERLCEELGYVRVNPAFAAERST